MIRSRLVCRCVSALLASGLSTTLVACGGGGDGPTGPAAVASIALTAPLSTLTSIGETTTLSAVAKSAKGAAISGATLVWTSSSPDVASVSGGVVTAVGNGSTTISAASGSITGSVQVTVQQTVTAVAVSFASDTIRALGDTVRAAAVARDARGNAVGGKNAVWASLAPSIASIDAAGVVTAVSEGAATITASIDAQQAQRVVQVRQRAAKLVITVQPTGARAGVALATQPVIEVQDARGSRITSDNATVVTASVSSGGGSVTAGGTATAVNGVVAFSSLAVGGLIGSRVLQLSAAGAGSVNSLNFTLTAGNASTLVVAAGNAQSGLASTALAQPLTAGVRDAFGNGVAGVSVAFSTTQGGGTVSPAQGTSDANGAVSTTLTLSRFAGPHAVVATSTQLAGAQASFAATATPNGVISGTITVLGNTAAGVASAMRAPLSNTRTLRGAPAAPPLASVAKVVNTPMSMVSGASGSADAGSPPDGFVPGELLVTYKAGAVGAAGITTSAWRSPSVAMSERASIAAAIAPMVDDGVVTVEGVSPVLMTARVRLQPGVSEATAMARLRSDPRVQSVERNGYARPQVLRLTPMQELLKASGYGTTMPPAAYATSPFGDPVLALYPGGGVYPGNAMYVNQSWHYNMIDLPRAWQQTTGSATVIVAVVDDGTHFEHPAMAGMLTADGYDFVSAGNLTLCAGGTISRTGDGDGPDPDPTQPAVRPFNNAGTCVNGVTSSGNHGLHVAGTIGALRTNSLGVAGVNWAVRMRPVRVCGIEDSCTFFDMAQGILYAAGLPADNGAGGVVTAAGGPARVMNLSLGATTNSAVVSSAVQQAFANGTLIVASAGNSNNSVPQYPAAYPNVVAVSAVGPSTSRASYSSFGAFVTMAAPGGDISAGDVTYGVYSSAWNYQTSLPIVDSYNGTSMAAPHVTGVAALIAARTPSLTAAQLRQRLLDGAVDYGIAGPDNIYGVGLLNARNSVSGTTGPAKTVYVRLINASTGVTVTTVAAAAGGAYTFGGLADGSYWVYAGEDEDGDAAIGVPMRRWGAFGAASLPTAIVVNGAGAYPASLVLNAVNEVEPNETPATANELVVDGYIMGQLANLIDQDYYRLRITQAGTYTIDVTGQSGACRYALEADPVLAVFSGAGTQLGANDDVDFANKDYCARVSLALTPADYFVRVSAAFKGRYVVSARKQ